MRRITSQTARHTPPQPAPNSLRICCLLSQSWEPSHMAKAPMLKYYSGQKGFPKRPPMLCSDDEGSS